jgi:hypothetical protein
VKFFFDNCLAPSFARALNIFGETQGYPQITHPRDKFKPHTKDPTWIRALGEEGDWVIVSGDPRISRGRHEREAWLESGLTAFFMAKGWMNQRLWDQAWNLVRWWPVIVDQAERIRPGAGFLVPLKGTKLEQLVISR